MYRLLQNLQLIGLTVFENRGFTMFTEDAANATDRATAS